MTKKRTIKPRPAEPVEDRGLLDEEWFDEVDPDRDGEYWNPGRRVAQPRLSDEEPEE